MTATRNKSTGRHKLHDVWYSMKGRCYCESHTSYKYYGAKGICVYKPWLSNYSAFKRWAIAVGWKPGLELDRIDNDKNYSPGNCRFVTCSENHLNMGLRSDNKTGYKGVSIYRDGRFCAFYKSKYLGLFNTIEEAAEARSEYVKSRS